MSFGLSVHDQNGRKTISITDRTILFTRTERVELAGESNTLINFQAYGSNVYVLSSGTVTGSYSSFTHIETTITGPSIRIKSTSDTRIFVVVGVSK